MKQDKERIQLSTQGRWEAQELSDLLASVVNLYGLFLLNSRLEEDIFPNLALPERGFVARSAIAESRVPASLILEERLVVHGIWMASPAIVISLEGIASAIREVQAALEHAIRWAADGTYRRGMKWEVLAKMADNMRKAGLSDEEILAQLSNYDADLEKVVALREAGKLVGVGR